MTGHTLPKGLVQLPQIPPRRPRERRRRSLPLQLHPPAITPSTRFTAGIPRGGRREAATWDVEELVAMQFAYVRALAEEAAGERVQDVVVTVPAFYAQFERDAIADAVELAGYVYSRS
jgi:molecular chaperone DnaK (HSP70)